jgi:hypothetical protein
VPPPVHAPAVQVWPAAQAWLQLPQFAVLVFVSTQLVPQSICPAPEQAHVPALQTAPAGQAFPQAPQLKTSLPFSTTQVRVLGQSVVLAGQLPVQLVPSQTWLSGQTMVQVPQCMASDSTQALLQERSPAWHAQDPF